MKVVSYLLVSICALMMIAKLWPEALSDEHTFLESFVGVNFLSFMGIILTITIASLSQLHFSLNAFEERLKVKLPERVRKEIWSNVRWLLSIFAFSFAIVIAKPFFGGDAGSQTIFNGAALIVVGLYFLILSDIASSVFLLEPSEEELDALDDEHKNT